MKPIDKRITDKDAAEAAEKLVRYCVETGCLNCQFVEMDSPDIDCDVNRPREWSVKHE